MLKPIYENSFIKDIKKAVKQGKDIEKFKTVAKILIEETPLQAKYKNHKLKGGFVGRWECHIEPDWLLIYRKIPRFYCL